MCVVVTAASPSDNAVIIQFRAQLSWSVWGGRNALFCCKHPLFAKFARARCLSDTDTPALIPRLKMDIRAFFKPKEKPIEQAPCAGEAAAASSSDSSESESDC